MARTETVIAAPVEQVWAALMDPWLYTQWVVGNKRVRGVDGDWPRPGSRFHHTVGLGPLATRDFTRLVTAQEHRRVELDAHAWPVGTARVVLELEPVDGGTRVVMHEEPTRGPAKWMETRLLHGFTHGRNVESLRRLRRMVEHRARSDGDAGAPEGRSAS
ncbi:MAG TPA: SRPBCC domain-containing protein [Egibacteraceae bacterium]|nr:SRPBCC domain-containing protein [Egibacteraceae bacterium]